MGSAISNILGAFSLGLLFQKEACIFFDRSSRIYTTLLLSLTIIIAVPVSLDISSKAAHKTIGVVLIAIFAIYYLSIAWLIWRGILSSPESDSDSESDSQSGSSSWDEEDASENVAARSSMPPESSTQNRNNTVTQIETQAFSCSDSTPLLQDAAATPHEPGSLHYHSHSVSPRHYLTRARFMAKHALLTLLNFTLLLLSAYVLTSTSSTIVLALGISDGLFGLVILSLATTLPEKFVAVVSARKSASGIVVANTVGSNIFLLSLGLGVWFLGSEDHAGAGRDTSGAVEVATLVLATGTLTGIVWMKRVGLWWARVLGAGMVGGYIAFIVLEFTSLRE